MLQILLLIEVFPSKKNSLILNEENLSKYEKATVKRYSTQRHPV